MSLRNAKLTSKLLLGTFLVGSGVFTSPSGFEVKIGGKAELQYMYRDSDLNFLKDNIEEITGWGGDYQMVTLQETVGGGSFTLDESKSYKIENSMLAMDASLNLDALYKKKDFRYGISAIIDANSGKNKFGKSNYSREFFAFMEKGDGLRVEVGSMKSVLNSLRVSVSDIAVAAGGVVGDALYWIPEKVIDIENENERKIQDLAPGEEFLLYPVPYMLNLHLRDEIADTFVEDGEGNIRRDDKSFKKSIYNRVHANKISVIGKKERFTFGLSFIPSSTVSGFFSKTDEKNIGENSRENRLSFKNIWNYGGRYDTFLKGGKLALYFGGEYGNSNDNQLYKAGKREDISTTLNTQEVGVSYSLKMHNIALNLGRYDKSTFGVSQDEEITTNHSSTYLSAGYTMQRELFDIGISTTYSKRGLNLDKYLGGGGEKPNFFNALSIGLEYKGIPGIRPYIEGNYYKMKFYTGISEIKDLLNNKSDNLGVLITGIRFSF